MTAQGRWNGRSQGLCLQRWGSSAAACLFFFVPCALIDISCRRSQRQRGCWSYRPEAQLSRLQWTQATPARTRAHVSRPQPTTLVWGPQPNLRKMSAAGPEPEAARVRWRQVCSSWQLVAVGMRTMAWTPGSRAKESDLGWQGAAAVLGWPQRPVRK